MRNKMGFFTAFSFLMLTGCMPLGDTTTTGSNTTIVQLIPSSTTVSTNQSMNFQVSGGTTPYQYQLTGVGSIDSSGNYQSGAYAGQSQIQVTDANGNTGAASVSVVLASNTYTNPAAVQNSQLADGWVPTSSSELKRTPFLSGQLLAVSDYTLRGERIQSRFLKTNLKHPLIRVDELIEGGEKVAVRAVVEDQFWVQLMPGKSESDLTAILSRDQAHISKRGAKEGGYLVSLEKEKDENISGELLAHRKRLKEELQAIARVEPNFVTRAPASN